MQMMGESTLDSVRAEVFNLIDAERGRQEVKWGHQTHPNGTDENYSWIADAYRDACDQAARDGLVTWHDILLEEVFEALAEEDEVKLQTELIQAIAVAVNWVEDLLRRQNG
jgi:hypothetical protein